MIRRAEGRDAAGLALLLRALNSEPGLHPGRITAQGVVRDLIGDARVEVLVAEQEGALLGFATGHPFYDSGTSRWGAIMNDLYVTPEARRQGIGHALVAALAAEAARDGAQFLSWDADGGDDLALAFHRSLGATEARTCSFLVADAGFDALVERA